MHNWKFNHIDFSTYPYYGGDDLGVVYSENKLQVKIWAPSAIAIEFRLYKESDKGFAIRLEKLKASEDGIWELTLDGNFEGLYYTFKIYDGDWLNEVPDIYAKAVGANGKRGLIYNPKRTNPDGWEHDKQVTCANPVDSVIYELHVRDFSSQESANFDFPGKFKAFTEEGKKNKYGESIGVDHLKELGITHVHLLPVNDFYTVDDLNPKEKYNWGYDPLHFNVPEGSYSTNPKDISRIRELKELVQYLHSNGIGVILDVVYNHTGFTRRSVFNQTVPGYFYRQKPSGLFANASGCGNEIASERSMVRKYIIDSLRYWAKEFHIDGFRFDLMGILDIETMNQIRKELIVVNPSILLYGEGWTADKSPLDEQYRAVKGNVTKLDHIAVFNDDMRDAIKGNNFDIRSKGFVSGLTLREEQLKFGVVAACYHPQINYAYVESSKNAWAEQPWQCINYASCHDNYTLYDKLKLSSPDDSDDQLKKMVRLSGAIVLCSQGIPFLHAGVEMGRTKQGDHNSYKSPDIINQIDWNRKSDWKDVNDYYKKLIQLRKEHPAFRMNDAGLMRKHLEFVGEYQTGVVSFCLKENANGDSWKEILIVFNGNKNIIDYKLDTTEIWNIVAFDEKIDLTASEVYNEATIDVPATSMLMLIRK